MTVARKGSRLIEVGGTVYRWTVRRRPTYCQANGWMPLTFVVEEAGGWGALLVVTMPCAHPGNWLELPSRPVLPSTVAGSVTRALADGWRPGFPGPVFPLAG
jgi:hypothetical protein